MDHRRNKSIQRKKGIIRLAYFPVLYALCSTVLSSPLFAQTDSVIIKTSDTSSDIARLTITTSTGAGAQANIYNNLAFIGIGTTTPSTLLHISAGTSGDAELLMEADTDDNNEADNPYITFQQDNNAVNAFIAMEGAAGTRSTDTLADAFVIGSEDGDPYLQFITNDTAQLHFEPAGDIGIGTSNPTSTLTVYGTFTLGSSATSTMSARQTNEFGDSSTWEFDADGDGNGFLRIQTADDSFFIYDSSTMTIRTSDTAIVDGDVLGSFHFAAVDAGAQTNLIGAMIVGEADGTWDGADPDDAPTNLEFYTEDDTTTDNLATPRMTIASDGNVGIGTEDPSELLHIYKSSATTNAVNRALNISRTSSGTTAVGFGTGILFQLEEDAGALDSAGTIECNYYDLSEDGGRISFSTPSDVLLGTMTKRITIHGDENDGYSGGGSSVIRLQGRTIGDAETEHYLFYAAFSDDTNGSEDTFFAIYANDAGTEAMRIDDTGRVGIGTSSPTFLLDIEDNLTGANAIWRVRNTDTTDGKEGLRLIFSGDATVSANDDYIQFQDSGGEVGRIHSEVTYGTFTGAHEGQTEEDSSAWKPGMILCSTGVTLSGQTMGRSLVQLRLAQKRMEKAAIGVFVFADADHDSANFDRSKPVIQYNALGEGLILVTDTMGNIEVGDFITTSPRAGYGERQQDDLYYGYTVAKATQPVDWSKVKVDSKTGFKWKRIACTYHSG